jgi:hypothetical protein
MNVKKNYYLDSVSEFMVFKYFKIPIRNRKIIPNPPEYYEIDAERLKKTNPEMYSMLEQKMYDENERRRAVKAKGALSIPKDTKDKMNEQLQKIGLASRLDLNNFLKENDPAAYQEKINKQWPEDRRKISSQSMSNIPKESKSKNGHRLKQILTNDDRQEMAKKSNKTKRLERDPIIKKIYNTIQTNDWFLISDIGPICENLGYNSHRNYRNLQNAIEGSAFGKELFEVKVVNMKPSKKKFFRKISLETNCSQLF